MLDSLCSLFLTFLAYSCLGWAFESLCCSVIARRPINRGFLTGPVCPIYGVGALLVIYLLSPFAGSLPLLFVAAVLVTSVLEYVTGWALETLFHAKWWDYSDHRFNIHGRVCLQNALVFGVLGVVVVRIIHPVVEGWILSLGGTALYLVSGGLFLVFAADLATTLITLIRLQGKLAQLQQLAAQLRQRSEAYQQALELNLNLRRSELEEMLESRLQELHRRREALGLPSREELSEKLEESLGELRRRGTSLGLPDRETLEREMEARLQELRRRWEERELPSARDAKDHLSQEMDDRAASLRFPYRRLLEAFPTLKSHRYQGALDRLRESLDRLGKGGKER